MESRIFWKAGNCDVGSRKSFSSEGQLEHARVHPKFLHSNATSHKWAFGAIAELLDNAVDEISSGATFIEVDKFNNPRDNSPALLFKDDGGGMDPERMRQCMSLGYSSKKGNSTIGQYGNGFKTSTMRLGADAIVFSRTTHGSHATQSIGLLSYTFLRTTDQDDVIVPMVNFELSEHQAQPIIYSSQDDWLSNLKIILEWSPFVSEKELMLQFDDIGSHGTKIIVYNLWLDDDGVLELDFDCDREDICLRDDSSFGKVTRGHDKLIQSHISYRFRYSLRAYTSILYLRKLSNFSIVLRGKPVQQYHISEDLQFSKVTPYKPQLGRFSKEVSVQVTVGFVKEAPLLGVSGFNIYHKNRLIRPFWRLVNEGSFKGRCVVGVLEANFIEPAHDKQDFERSDISHRLELRLRTMVTEYWTAHCHLIGVHSQGRPRTADRQKKQYSDELVIESEEQDLRNAQPMNVLSANSPELADFQPITRHAAASSSGMPSLSSSELVSVDQIKEENLKLFVRAEAHRMKENDLKRTIVELERKLQEEKKRCARLSSYLENRRNQKDMKLQVEKA